MYKVIGKIFNEMAAKAKKVELTEAFIEAFSGVTSNFIEPSQTSKVEPFVKIVNSIKLLIIFTKDFILNV